MVRSQRRRMIDTAGSLPAQGPRHGPVIEGLHCPSAVAERDQQCPSVGECELEAHQPVRLLGRPPALLRLPRPDPPGDADRRLPSDHGGGRRTGHGEPTVHHERATVGRADPDRGGLGQHRRWRRPGRPPRPGPVTLRRTSLAAGLAGASFVAPRDQGDPVREPPAAAEHGGEDRLRTELTLYPHQGTMRPLVGHADLAPQARLHARVPDHTVGDEPQPVDARGRSGRQPPADGSARAGEPTVELPADPVGEAGGVEQPVVSPHPVQLLAGRGVRLDAEPGGGQAVPGQPFVQLFRECPGGEGGHVDAFQRWVVVAGHRQVGRRLAYRQRASLLPSREAVRVGGVEPEPRQDVSGGQGGEVGQGTHTEAPQQVGEVGTVQGRDVHPGEEVRSRVGWHDAPGPGSEHGGEDSVGYAGLDLHRAGESDVLDEPFGRLRLTTEVARRPAGRDRAGPRPHHLHPRRELLHRGHDRFERPGVATRIVLHHHQVRAASLRLALAQSPADPLGPRRRRADQHPVGVQHRHRPVHVHALGDPGRDHRPVRAPQHQRPHGHPLRLWSTRVSGSPAQPWSTERR